ncbi:hypothetical protein [Floridanema evergladense]|uniref:Uncharacterized protein n=1 Tax=Floridaenema evergladense BLCC-F167 TaxID=3153639 RepID=A0ABV4WNY5_9CYAN
MITSSPFLAKISRKYGSTLVVVMMEAHSPNIFTGGFSIYVS